MTLDNRDRITTTIGRWRRTLVPGDLAAKTLRGGAVLGIGSLAEQLVRFARNIVLARWLAPEAFGTMAIVLSINSAVSALMDVGAREALIQEPNASDSKYLETAWLLTFCRGLSVCLTIVIAAPYLAAFYGNSSLTAMLRVVGAAALFDGAMSSRAHLAVKELKLWKWAIVSNVGGILGVLTAIALSLYLRNVWALVIGFASESAARCALSFIVCPFMPRLRWHSQESRRIFAFSRGLFGLSFLNLLYARADIFALGKLYAPAVVGSYALSIYLVQTPVTFLLSLLSSTLLPTFANVASRPDRLRDVHIQTVKLLLVLGVPVVAVIVCCAPSIIEFTYGPAYRSAAGALRIAAVGSLAYVLNGEITMTFYAQGKPELHRMGVAITSVLMLLLVYPAIIWLGPNGAQVASVLSVAVGYLYQCVQLHRTMSIPWSSVRGMHSIPAAAAIVVVGTFMASRVVFGGTGPVGTVLIAVASIVVGYAVAGALLFRQHAYAAA